MAAVVQIEVRLDDKGVVTGVRNIEGGLQKVGQRGNLVFTEITKQQKNARDAAQLLSRSLGVEIPGALQKTLAKSQLLGGTLAAAFNVSVALAFAQAVATIVVDAIQKVIEHVNKFDDLVAEMETRRAITANKLIIDAEERNRDLKLQIAKSTANDLKKIDLQVAFDKENTQKRLREATENADIFAARQLQEQLLLIEKEGVAQKLAVRLALGEKAAAKARQEAEGERGVLDQLRNMRNQAAAAGLPQEQALLTAWSHQIDKLIEIKEEYKKRPAVVATVNETIKALDQAATRELAEIRKKLKDQSDQELQEKNQKIIDVERETAIARAEANGDMIEVMRLQEQFRVTDTIAKIQALVDAEKVGSKERADLEVKLAQLRQALNAQSAAKIISAEQDRNQQIIQENQRMVDQLAGAMESLWDDIWSGNIAKSALRMVKRFFFQVLAQWLLTLSGMRNAAASGLGGGGGGILGTIFGGLLGSLGGGFGGGGFGGIGGIGGVAPTPPFFGSSFLGGGAGLTGIGGGGVGVTPGFGAPLGAGLPSSGVGARGAQQTFGSPLDQLFGKLFKHGLKLGGLKIPGGVIGSAGATLALLGIGSGNVPLSAIGGALTGFSIGGLPGGIVGGIAGLLGGLFSKKSRSKKAFQISHAIFLEAKAKIDEIRKAYEDHQLDFLGANSGLDQLRTQTAAELIEQTAFDRNSIWGKRTIKQGLDPAIKEAKEAIQRIEDARQARGSVEFGPPQFHSGGFTGAGAGEFTAKLLRGEFVVNPQATAEYRHALERINNSSQSAAAPASTILGTPRFHSGGYAGGPMLAGPTIQIYAIDSADVENWLRNRGGLRAISKEMNRSLREYNR